MSREQRECRQAIERKARHGNVWLRRSLCQAAWAASHTKSTYLSAQLRRLAARKENKRAVVAVAHSFGGGILHAQQSAPYRDLGADYFDRRNPEQVKRSLVRRLEGLGLKVTISPATAD